MAMVAYRPFAWQKTFHAAKAKHKYVWAGRRAGKGRSAIQETLSNIVTASKTPLVYDDGVDATNTLIPPIHVWTVGPTNAQLRQVWNEMKEYIPPYMVSGARRGQAGGRNRTGWKEDELFVWLELRGPNGKYLPNTRRRRVLWELKTADNPDALQTTGLDVLHITEAQDIKEAAWNKVRPTVNSPGRLGRTIVEGIPPLSKAHWFSRRWWSAHKRPSDLAVAFKATTYDNSLLTREQLEDVESERENTPEVIWKRMYLAEQPEGGGGFFRKIDKARVGSELSEPEVGHTYVAGLDLGKQIDPSVLVIKDKDTRHSVFAMEMLKIDWQVQLPRIVAECQRFNVQEVWMDSTGMGGDVLYEDLVMRGLPVLPVKFTTTEKYQLFLNYALALEHETVTFPADWTKLPEQLDAMTAQQSGMGYIFRQIDDGHDDWVDAEALALKGCNPAQTGISFVLHAVPGSSPITGDTVKIRKDQEFWARRKAAKRGTQRFPDYIENGEEVYLK